MWEKWEVDRFGGQFYDRWHVADGAAGWQRDSEWFEGWPGSSVGQWKVRMRILIAVPVFNEQKYLQPVLAKIRSFHPDVLVVDDGSTDQTPTILAKLRGVNVIRHPENRGYGQSLIDAFAWADERGYDWVITMDCDEQHEPEMIPEFIRLIKTDEWDVISG